MTMRTITVVSVCEMIVMDVSSGFAKDLEIWIVICKLRDSAKREKKAKLQSCKIVNALLFVINA